MAVQETSVFKVNGFFMVAVQVGLVAAIAFLMWKGITTGIDEDHPTAAFFWGLALTVPFSLLWSGFYTVQPNEARVLVFVGRYIGTNTDDGFWWSNPFATKRHISLRVRNFNSERIKVNDAQGNPIEIAAVVAWKVTNPAKAVLDVEQFEPFVNVQSETAIRSLASRFPYDSHDDDRASLRGSPEEVAQALRAELQHKLDVAGVHVVDARISHLAYAPEIAQAMLRRQQANAIIAARQLIVEGAVGMVEMALRRLSEHRIIELDEERKAAMVSNLLVVLVSESEAQPVVNAGTLY